MTVLHSLPCIPNAEAITAFVQALTRNCGLRGLIELAWTPQDSKNITAGRLYGLDEIDDLVREATRLNGKNGRNVYIGPALRREDATRDRRSSDLDSFAALAVWTDCDAEGSLSAAREICERIGLPPSLITITGQSPHLRGQMLWLLDEPCEDVARVRRINEAFVSKFGADPNVVNIGRVMRIAGSVAWPKKDRRTLEMTFPQADGCRAAPYTIDEIESTLRRAGALEMPAKTGATILDFSGAKPQLELEDMLVAAEQPGQWHRYALLAVGHMLGRGTPPDVVADVLAPRLTMPGYTLAQTYADLRPMIEGGVRKGYVPDAEEARSVAAEPKVSGPPPLAAATFDGLIPPPRPWAYGRLLIKKGLTVIASPPGVGKTTFGFQLAVRFAMGLPWLGHDPIRTGNVLIVNGEEPLEEMMRRFLAACIEAGIDPAAVAPMIRMVSGFERPIKLVRQDKRNGVIRTGDEDLLNAVIAEHNAQLVILDPLVDLHGVEEKDNTALAEFMQVLREMAGANNVPVLAFSHVPKAARSDVSAGDLNAIRGGGAIGGAARIVLTMYGMTKEEADGFGLSADQALDYVRLDGAKASMSRRHGATVWLKKSGVSLDNAEDDYPADVVGVLSEASLEAYQEPGPPKTQRALREIWNLLSTERGLTNGEISTALSKDKGNVSRQLKELETDGFAARDGSLWFRVVPEAGCSGVVNHNSNENNGVG